MKQLKKKEMNYLNYIKITGNSIYILIELIWK